MQIYLGTVALEINRWGSRIPSYLVSEWIPKIKTAGFAGLELWENHVLQNQSEAEKIKDSGFPVVVYNHYGLFTNEQEELRNKAINMINFLGAKAVKFNIGNDPALLNEYKENVKKFASSINATMLCECHDGTLLETNDGIASFFEDLCPQKFKLIVHPFGEPSVLRKKFELFGDRIVLMHSQTQNAAGERVCLEEQAEQVQACFSVMKEYNFAGDFTIEFTSLTALPGENINDLFANAIKDMEYVKRSLL